MKWQPNIDLQSFREHRRALWIRVVVCAGLLALTATTTDAIAQSNPVAPADPTAPSGRAAPTPLPAPVGHRQPQISDLPPDLQRKEQDTAAVQATAPSERTKVSKKRGTGGASGRSAVPAFDIKKSCQGRAIAAVFAGRDSKSCIESEEATREQLKNIWGEFSAKDKEGCVVTATIGGIPSYAELLTCLEIIRDVDKIHTTSSDKPEGEESVRSRRKRP
jgi:hypothetical protein